MTMLNNNWLIERLQTIDSTQKYAKKLIESEKLQSKQIAIIAAEQSDGYGRYSRKWHSEKGNLYMTIIVPSSNLMQCQANYVTCLAVGETIKIFNESADIQYKWINDVLLSGKKVSGSIAENIKGYFLVGIGVNINSSPDLSNETIKSTTNSIGTTSLMQNGIKTDIDIFVEKLLNKFTELYNLWNMSEFSVIRKLWKKNAYKLHEEINFSHGNEIISGVFHDIGEDGSIMVKRSEIIEKFYSGEI